MRVRLSKQEKRFLERARVCRVASVDRRGQAHVAPLCHAFDPATRTAYVTTAGVTARNLRERRRGAIECDDYFEDWDRLRGIVAHVSAKLIRRGPELDRARRLLQRKFKQYRVMEIDEVIALRSTASRLGVSDSLACDIVVANCLVIAPSVTRSRSRTRE